MTTNRKSLEWHHLKMFEGEMSEIKRIPAVELTFAIVGNGNIMFSHTPGMIDKEGEFQPTAHLRGELMVQYIPLMEKSMQLEQKTRARYDSKVSHENLTASFAEIIAEHMGVDEDDSYFEGSPEDIEVDVDKGD